MSQTGLTVIGAGPAGIFAALEAARSNVSVTLIDENIKPGGQIYRQISDSFIIDGVPDREYRQGIELIEQIKKYESKIRVLSSALVWGLFANNKQVAILHEGRNKVLQADKLIIAEGAYDRPMPFPGWTLPGVFTAGGVLRMLKTENILPGRRVLLSGTGPLQLLLAAKLAKAGADVIGVMEASSITGGLKYLPNMLGPWQILKEGWHYLQEIRKHRIPYLLSHAITAAHGVNEVREVTVSRIDGKGNPIPGTERILKADAVCIGYGIIPSNRLSRLCGCAQYYNPDFGCWVPYRDEYLESNLDGVFVIGDGASIGGALVASDEGRLVALRACNKLGSVSTKEFQKRSAPLLKRLKKLRKFEDALNRITTIRQGFYARIVDDTIICRCEEITAGEIRQAIIGGATNILDVKRLTRTGMGYCQGRMCESTIAGMISMLTSRPIDTLGHYTIRPPIKPISLNNIAEEDGT